MAERDPAVEGEHRPPKFGEGAYHCPHCGVLAPMYWIELKHYTGGSWTTSAASRVLCSNCRGEQFWVGPPVYAPLMLIPAESGGPRAHLQMPNDVRPDYDEARQIVMQSPRGACALLRLATQKLVNDLVPGKIDLDKKIGTLVGQGLPDEVRQALDVLRGVGNNAVHPGELRLDDDTDTATGLFECINVIIEDRIARPKRIAGLFDKLPQGAREAIEKRDQKALPSGEEEQTSPATNS